MCLGLSETDLANTYSDNKEKQLRALFDPLVRPEMRDSWEKQWKSWFVTTNEVPDLRKPGKLKGNSFRKNCYLLYAFRRIHFDKRTIHSVITEELFLL